MCSKASPAANWSHLTPAAIDPRSVLRTSPQTPWRHSLGRRDTRAGIGLTPSPQREKIVDDLYENAPCGYIVAQPDRRIVRVNATLLGWLGYGQNALMDKAFTDLLAVGSRIHYETHFAPLLQLQGQLGGITVDL